VETNAYTTRKTHHGFWEGGRFYLNRKENIGLDQTKENKREIKENSDKRISAFRPLFAAVNLFTLSDCRNISREHYLFPHPPYFYIA
jgi:hypothetical protein